MTVGEHIVSFSSHSQLLELEAGDHRSCNWSTVTHVEEAKCLHDVGAHEDEELPSRSVVDNFHAENQFNFSEIFHLEEHSNNIHGMDFYVEGDSQSKDKMKVLSMDSGGVGLSVLHTVLLLEALTDKPALALAEDPSSEEDILVDELQWDYSLAMQLRDEFPGLVSMKVVNLNVCDFLPLGHLGSSHCVQVAHWSVEFIGHEVGLGSRGDCCFFTARVEYLVQAAAELAS